jgi:hypothetical protein
MAMISPGEIMHQRDMAFTKGDPTISPTERLDYTERYVIPSTEWYPSHPLRELVYTERYECGKIITPV